MYDVIAVTSILSNFIILLKFCIFSLTYVYFFPKIVFSIDSTNNAKSTQFWPWRGFHTVQTVFPRRRLSPTSTWPQASKRRTEWPKLEFDRPATKRQARTVQVRNCSNFCNLKNFLTRKLFAHEYFFVARRHGPNGSCVSQRALGVPIAPI